jgi:hypothetical protein
MFSQVSSAVGGLKFYFSPKEILVEMTFQLKPYFKRERVTRFFTLCCYTGISNTPRLSFEVLYFRRVYETVHGYRIPLLRRGIQVKQ